MVKNIQFSVLLTRPEVENLTKNYFQLHKYYRLQSKDGLRFRGYQEMQSLLSPSRLTDSVQVDIAEFPSGCRVNCTLNLIDQRTTTIDDEYFEAFLEHFKQAILQRKITVFSGEKFELESKKYSKLYWWFLGASIPVGLLVVWVSKIDFSMIAVVILSQTAAYWWINRMRKQKMISS